MHHVTPTDGRQCSPGTCFSIMEADVLCVKIEPRRCKAPLPFCEIRPRLERYSVRWPVEEACTSIETPLLIYLLGLATCIILFLQPPVSTYNGYLDSKALSMPRWDMCCADLVGACMEMQNRKSYTMLI